MPVKLMPGDMPVFPIDAPPGVTIVEHIEKNLRDFLLCVAPAGTDTIRCSSFVAPYLEMLSGFTPNMEEAIDYDRPFKIGRWRSFDVFVDVGMNEDVEYGAFTKGLDCNMGGNFRLEGV